MYAGVCRFLEIFCKGKPQPPFDQNAVNLIDTSIFPERINYNGIYSLSCLPIELGGCGNSHL
ncbi:hypothetical protein DEO72_LG10g1245 [Vigna unguiculata]|uniref:Uncharacterized protein n=1 Tax=Vigna unguiculata TaxID=3917 RepID=A0A4D6NAW1_VIGUN|nr:hypothetical protein DEO72_LG10g1245 [Vigna unguiculata]